MKPSLLLALLILVGPSFAGVFTPAYSEGVIKSFDEKTVTLVDDEGSEFKVQREEISKKYKLQQGERVVIHVTPPPVRLKQQLPKAKK